jgi:membrane associated rhomboid family serine protease
MERSEIARAFWYLTLTSTIPIMAFLGYIIGKEFNVALQGALAGALLGTLLMWLDILRTQNLLFRRKKKTE